MFPRFLWLHVIEVTPLCVTQTEILAQADGTELVPLVFTILIKNKAGGLLFAI